jgi:hypothetical protein
MYRLNNKTTEVIMDCGTIASLYTGIKIMQPKASRVICFSWREIATTTKGRCRNPGENRKRTPRKSSRRVRAISKTKHIFTRSAKVHKQDPNPSSGCRGGGGRIAFFCLGGELPGSERLVQGQYTEAIQFSCR